MRASSDDHPFSLAEEVQIAAAGTETFRRFNQLMLHGYKPNYEYSNEEAFCFDHPRRSFEYHSVALYPSGVMRSIFAKDETEIERWDVEGFKDFMREVPIPNWWERARGFRDKLWGFLIVAIFYGLIFFGIRLVKDLFNG